MTRNPFASDWLRSAADERQRPHGGMSYVSGATDEPLQFVTVPQLLDETVRRVGARDAAIFVDDGHRLSWHDLRRRSDEVAAGLLALGVKRGDRVGIWAPNCMEWLLVQFGTARIGAILVNINPAYRTSELEYALNKVECRVLVMARSLKTSDYVAMMRSLAPELDRVPSSERLRLERFPRLRHVVLIGEGSRPKGMMPFAELIRMAGPAHSGRLQAISDTLDPDDAINIQFTSGTTGAPKGATLSHFNIVNNARFCAQAMNPASTTGFASRCPCITVLEWFSECFAAPRLAPRWYFLEQRSMPNKRYGLCRISVALPCTVYRRCSSRCWSTRNSIDSSWGQCAPGSWPEHPVRLIRCAE